MDKFTEPLHFMKPEIVLKMQLTNDATTGFVMSHKKLCSYLVAGCLSLALSSCTISPELQARIDEFNSTIPYCSSTSTCQPKWVAAREWAVENSDFGIRSEGPDRIMASSNIISTSGLGVVVNRVPVGNGYQIVVDVECFSVYGCPDVWDTKINFNQTINAVQ